MSTTHLHRTLQRTNRVKRRTELLRAGAIVLAVLVAAVLGAIVIDAVAGLNAVGLLAGNALLAALVVVGVAFVLRALWRNRFNARRVARYVEERAGLRDSRLINAVDFESADATAGAVSPTLRNLAIDEGDRIAATVEPDRLIDRRPARVALLACAGALGAGLLLGLLAPRLVSMVLPRYLDPAGDHPPYTLVDFDVAVEPERIYHGRSAEIRATLTGPVMPDEASVVFVDPDGRRETQRRPMLRRENGLFTLPIDRATESRLFYIDTPHGRSKRHTLTVLPVPTFEKVTVRYEYPEYTGWPAVERALDAEGIVALRGTRVTVSIDSNVPLSMGFVRITPDTENAGESTDEATINLAPAAERPTNVAGSFTLTHSGVYALALRARGGAQSDVEPSGPVVAIEDGAPRIVLLEPDLRIMAPESWTVRTAFSASDDVGVARIALHLLHTPGGALTPDAPAPAVPLSNPIDLALDQRGPNHATAEHGIDLAAMGAKPGDSIRGFATVFDTHPGGTRSADSPTFEIHVISDEEYAELARERVRVEEIEKEMQAFIDEMQRLEKLRGQAIEQAEALKERVEQNADAEPTDQQREQAEALQRKLDDLSAESADLAERMKRRADEGALYEFEKPMLEELKKTAEQLAADAENVQGHSDRLPPPDRPKLESLLADLQRQQDAAASRRERHEQMQRDLEKLAMAEAMMAQAARIMAVAQMQRELADRFNAALGEVDPLTPDHLSRLRELAGLQREVRRELDSALDALVIAAEEAEHHLPRMSSSAIGLVIEIREELKVPADQQRAADEADALANGRAWVAADTAARKLEDLISRCEGMSGEQALGDLDGALGLSMGQLGQCMSQMSSGLQGSMPKLGSGSGQGAGGQSGSMQGPGGTQSGGSMGGTLAGPHTRRPGGPSDRVSDSDERGDAFSRADRQHPDAAGSSAERIDPEARNGGRRAPGDLDAAPLRYRSLIDAYFKRLADDSRGP